MQTKGVAEALKRHVRSYERHPMTTPTKPKIILVENQQVYIKSWQKALSEFQVVAFPNFGKFLHASWEEDFLDNTVCAVTNYYLDEPHTGMDVALRFTEIATGELPLCLSTNETNLDEKVMRTFTEILPKFPMEAASRLRRILAEKPKPKPQKMAEQPQQLIGLDIRRLQHDINGDMGLLRFATIDMKTCQRTDFPKLQKTALSHMDNILKFFPRHESYATKLEQLSYAQRDHAEAIVLRLIMAVNDEDIFQQPDEAPLTSKDTKILVYLKDEGHQAKVVRDLKTRIMGAQFITDPEDHENTKYVYSDNPQIILGPFSMETEYIITSTKEDIDSIFLKIKQRITRNSEGV